MPRRYIKVVGNKACIKYTPETLSAAVKSVEVGGISIRQAARQYDVPYGTLHNRINGLFGQKYGGQTVLTSAEERELCDVIHLAGEWGFPLSQPDIKFLVKSFLDTNQRTTRFKENLPGQDWISSFLTRNKETLSQRLSQNIKRVRAKVSPSVLNEYFDKLATTLEDVPAENILNYDETNFTDDPESKAVIVRRGQKHVENVLDHSKSSFSVMFAGAADGTLLSPYVVYASLHLYPTWTQGGPKGTRYNRSKSGWFDTTIFEDWFFSIALPHFKRLKNDAPKVLIGDNVASHLSYRVLRACLDNNIRFAFLPPNATHLCQPLDVAFFRPLKKSWKKTLEEWKKRNRGSVPKHLFPGLLKAAIDKIHENNAANLRSGFRATGIHPANRKEVLKKLPKEVESNATVSSSPNSSFSDQLMALLKRERYGENEPRNIPKRRRLMEIQPGESVTEEQAKELLAKKDLSSSNENVNPNARARNPKIKQEENDDPISANECKKLGKRARKQPKSNRIITLTSKKHGNGSGTNIKQEQEDVCITVEEPKKDNKDPGNRRATIRDTRPTKRASRIRS